MIKRLSWQSFLSIMILVSLFCGFALRGYWSLGGPDWAYWLSSFMSSAFGFFLGLKLILRGLKSIEYFNSNAESPKTGKPRIVFSIIVGTLIITVGFFVLMVTVRQIELGCSPHYMYLDAKCH